MSDTPIPSDPGEISSEIGQLEVRMRDTRAWAADTTAQERVRQLYEAQEAGGGEAPEAAPKSERMLEIEALMSDQHSAYHKGPESEALQAEYLALAEAAERNLSPDMTEPTFVATWSEAMDVPGEVVLDGMERARQIEDELGGNTGDLMASFEGLPDTVQHAARLALAEPERRIELLQSLTDSEHEQLAQWLSGMTEAEHKAVEKALGL